MKIASLERVFILGACSSFIWAAPLDARFLQVDPVGYKDQFNLYAYVANDPLDHTDPTGQDALLVTHSDGTRTLIIPVNYTGAGVEGANAANAQAIASRVNGISTGDSGYRIQVVVTSAPIAGVLNHMDVSPGMQHGYPWGEGQKSGPGPNGVGGHDAHINSDPGRDAIGAAGHDTLHFGGFQDQYHDDPASTPTNRLPGIINPGFDHTNIMADRAGTTLKPSQLAEPDHNPTTHHCSDSSGSIVCH
jgi:uncharacterized protein RhaS with RHS repeats